MRFTGRGWPWPAVRALVLTVAAALGLVACGGSDPAPSPGGARMLKAAPAPEVAAEVSGTYWDPFQPGTGFFFEAQGGTGVLTFYVFEAGGRSVWYTAAGMFRASGAGHEFAGSLQRYVGGQPATSPTPRSPQGTPAGEVRVQFAAGGNARVSLPGRSFDAVKFARSAAQLPAVPAGERPPIQPETGVYWNPAESGRGYTIEMINGYVNVGVFHYDGSGEPMWHLASAPMARTGLVRGDFVAYRGGQTLAGVYVAPTRSPAEGTLELRTLTACTVQMVLPGMPPMQLQRFGFDTAAPACRAGRPEGLPSLPPTGEPSLEQSGVSWQKYLSPWTSSFQEMQPIPSNATSVPPGKARFFVASGALPPGVRVHPDTGVISGAPLLHGTFTGRIGLQVDGYRGQVEADFLVPVRFVTLRQRGGSVDWRSFRIPAPAGVPLPANTGFYVDDGFSLAPARFAPGARVVFSITPATPLPPGVVLDAATGLLSGTPAPGAAKTTSITVRVDIELEGVAVNYHLATSLSHE